MSKESLMKELIEKKGHVVFEGDQGEFFIAGSLRIYLSPELRVEDTGVKSSKTHGPGPRADDHE